MAINFKVLLVIGVLLVLDSTYSHLLYFEQPGCYSVSQNGVRCNYVDANGLEVMFPRAADWTLNEVNATAVDEKTFSMMRHMTTYLCWINSTINDFQTLVAPSLKTFYFMHNVVGTISENAFENMTNLEELVFENNIIHKIGDFKVANQSSLLRMSFVNTTLEEIPKTLIQKSPSLETLDLRYNKIPVIEPDTFDYNQALEILDVAYNKLSFLAQPMFDKLKNLRELLLSNNRIFFIESTVLKNLKKLKVLDLSGNKLTHLGQDFFTNQRSLRSVSFSNNLITSIPESLFDTTTSLKNLGLSHLHMEDFNENILGNLHELLTLDLSYSNFSKMAANLFYFTPNIRELNMSHLVLQDAIAPTSLVTLRYLKSIDVTMFNRTTGCGHLWFDLWLNELYNVNNATIIGNTTVNMLPSLKVFKQEPLECIPDIPYIIPVTYRSSGQKLTLECKVYSYFDTHIEWKTPFRGVFNDERLADGSSFKFDPVGKLSIDEITVNDGGRYVCSAYNKFGKNERETNVMVKPINDLFLERSEMYTPMPWSAFFFLLGISAIASLIVAYFLGFFGRIKEEFKLDETKAKKCVVENVKTSGFAMLRHERAKLRQKILGFKQLMENRANVIIKNFEAELTNEIARSPTDQAAAKNILRQHHRQMAILSMHAGEGFRRMVNEGYNKIFLWESFHCNSVKTLEATSGKVLVRIPEYWSMANFDIDEITLQKYNDITDMDDRHDFQRFIAQIQNDLINVVKLQRLDLVYGKVARGNESNSNKSDVIEAKPPQGEADLIHMESDTEDKQQQ